MTLLSRSPISEMSCQRRNCCSKSVQAERDFAPLPGRDHQHFRRGNINALQIHQTRHGRLVECPDQLQRRLDLRNRDSPAGLHLGGVQRRSMTGNGRRGWLSSGTARWRGSSGSMTQPSASTW